MNIFLFTIDMTPGEASPNYVFIEIQAIAWDDLARKVEYTGSVANQTLLSMRLDGAYCMYGHMFNPARFTPRELAEALSGIKEWNTIIDGNVPEDPFYDEPLPHGSAR